MAGPHYHPHMTERRPFPPSPRRLALARQAGLTAASPLLVGALACGAAIIASVMLARAGATLVGDYIARACRAATGDADAATQLLAHGGATHIGPLVLELAMPLVGVVALVAFVAHVAQTRALWLPRRRVAGAPAIERARSRDALLELASAAVIGGATVGWLWTTAPRLAALLALEPTFDVLLVAIGSALASALVAFAIAWLALSILDALARRADLAGALAMTVAEKREDERLTAADPRWRAQRLALARGPTPREAVARAAVLLLGDATAVAIAWDARRQPTPLRTATGRDARATQLLGLARRHQIPVHRVPALAAQLVDGEGPVPDTHWAQLAEIIAAVQPANTGRDHSA